MRIGTIIDVFMELMCAASSDHWAVATNSARLSETQEIREKMTSFSGMVN